jgi:hypothetical protein
MLKLSRAALAMFLAMSVTGIAAAGSPAATGLGQAWPNATDVSANPNWHVYVFELNGVKYVQVNDLNGNVLGAIGTVGGQFMTLPMGRFSQYVSTPQAAAALRPTEQSSAAPTIIYRDRSTTVTALVLGNGDVQLSANCGTDPEECGVH